MKILLVSLLCVFSFFSFSQDTLDLSEKRVSIYMNVSQLLALKFAGGVEVAKGKRIMGVELANYLPTSNSIDVGWSSTERQGGSIEFNRKILYDLSFDKFTYHGLGLKISYEEYKPVASFFVDSTNTHFSDFLYDIKDKVYYKKYVVKKSWAEFNFKYGKIWYKRNLVIDLYGGGGIRAKYTTHHNYLGAEYNTVPNHRITRDKKGVNLVPVLKFGMNIGIEAY